MAETGAGGRTMKLTKRTVDAAVAEPKRYAIHDAALPGFKVVISPTGRKTYMVRYRVGGGRGGTIREASLGVHGVVTVDEARSRAREWAAQAAKGNDPAAERAKERSAPRMTDLAERYLAEHARPHKKPASAAEDERLLRSYILPAFGRRKVAEIGRAEVNRLRADLSDTPTTANRVLSLLSKMFNLAEEWDLRPDASNPCRHVKKYKEEARRRFLSAAELARLGDALRRAEEGEVRVRKEGSKGDGSLVPAQAVAAIRLLLFSGMRRSEVLGLKWEWVHLDERRIDLPDSKTGPKSIPLSPPALEVLSAIPRVDGNPHVIVGRKPGAGLVNVKDAWSAIREAADLPDVRIHDLRHSFAAVGASGGQGLLILGKLLGHSQASTTERYAHLADDPLRAATEAIGERIAAALDGGDGAEVVPLRGRRAP